jgi:hypothetical protein
MAEIKNENFNAGPEHGVVYTVSAPRQSIGSKIAQYIIGGSILAVLVCSCAWLCAAILSAMPRIQ